MVINYDIPMDKDHKPDVESYLHRSGRTARFGRKGITLNLVDGQASYLALQHIAQSWKINLEEIKMDNLEAGLTSALKQI